MKKLFYAFAIIGIIISNAYAEPSTEAQAIYDEATELLEIGKRMADLSDAKAVDTCMPLLRKHHVQSKELRARADESLGKDYTYLRIALGSLANCITCLNPRQDCEWVEEGLQQAKEMDGFK